MREARDFLRQPSRQASAEVEQVLLLGRLQSVSQDADRLVRPGLAGPGDGAQSVARGLAWEQQFPFRRMAQFNHLPADLHRAAAARGQVDRAERRLGADPKRVGGDRAMGGDDLASGVGEGVDHLALRRGAWAEAANGWSNVEAPSDARHRARPLQTGQRLIDARA